MKKPLISFYQLDVLQRKQAKEMVEEINGFNYASARKEFMYTLNEHGEIDKCLWMGLTI